MAENNEPKPPYGAGSWQAFQRLGLHELRAALYPNSNVAQPTEMGMYGTATPQEVANEKQNEVKEQESSFHRELREATERAEIEREREPREREMER